MAGMTRLQFERQFLQLASGYLRATYQMMTGNCYLGFGSAAFGRKHFDIRDAMMGATDHAEEMRLLCAEVLSR